MRLTSLAMSEKHSYTEGFFAYDGPFLLNEGSIDFRNFLISYLTITASHKFLRITFYVNFFIFVFMKFHPFQAI